LEAREYLMNGGDLTTLSDLMGHESVQTTAVPAGDFYAVFKRDELRRKHDEFSAVATTAREGKL
jgi:integrase/recombinase XerD